MPSHWRSRLYSLWAIIQSREGSIASTLEVQSWIHSLQLDFEKTHPWEGIKVLTERIHDRYLVVVVVAFPSLARISGECSYHSFPTCVFVCFVFFKWRLAYPHWFHSLCQDQSTVAQWAERTVAKGSLTSCSWAHFRIGSHICATAVTQGWNRVTDTE